MLSESKKISAIESGVIILAIISSMYVGNFGYEVYGLIGAIVGYPIGFFLGLVAYYTFLMIILMIWVLFTEGPKGLFKLFRNFKT